MSHSKIEDNNFKKEFPTLESLMASKKARANSKKKKNYKNKNNFYKQVKENRENNGENNLP